MTSDEHYCTHCGQRWVQAEGGHHNCPRKENPVVRELGLRIVTPYRVTERHDPMDFWQPRYMEGGL